MKVSMGVSTGTPKNIQMKENTIWMKSTSKTLGTSLGIPWGFHETL